MSLVYKDVLGTVKEHHFVAGSANFGEFMRHFMEGWEKVRAKVAFYSAEVEEWRRIDAFFHALPSPLQERVLNGHDFAQAHDILPNTWAEMRELAREVNRAYGETVKAAQAAQAQASKSKPSDGFKKRSFSSAVSGAKDRGDSSKRQASQGNRGRGGSGRGRGGGRDGNRGGSHSGGRDGGRGRGRGGGRGHGDGKKAHFDKKDE